MNYQKDKPLIGVIGRVVDNKICLNDEIRYAVHKSGGIPTLILPNQKIKYNNKKIKKLTNKEKKELKRIIDNIDGLILQGGNTWYEFDEYIYKYALIKDIPILGICLGMQMMCKIDVDKGKVKDNTLRNNTIINHNQNIKYVHDIKLLENTILKKIIKKEIIKVNSRHNYHVEKLKYLKISAYSIDGLIEGVEYYDKNFVIGLQWHPESTYDNDIYSRRIFKNFIHTCKKEEKNGL